MLCAKKFVVLILFLPFTRRNNISQAPWQVEAEKKKQEAIQAVLNAPRPEHPEPEAAEDGSGPAKMDADMGEELPE